MENEWSCFGHHGEIVATCKPCDANVELCPRVCGQAVGAEESAGKPNLSTKPAEVLKAQGTVELAMGAKVDPICKCYGATECYNKSGVEACRNDHRRAPNPEAPSNQINVEQCLALVATETTYMRSAIGDLDDQWTELDAWVAAALTFDDEYGIKNKNRHRSLRN